MSSKIPVRNIFYMLSYAWDRLQQSKQLLVDFNKIDTPRDLLVRLLITGTRQILRRGIWRDYVSREESMRLVRGKLELKLSIEKDGLANGKVFCRWQQLSPNVLVNQIIFSTMHSAIRSEKYTAQQVKDMRELVSRFPDVSIIPLNKNVFEAAKIHRNNAYYDLVIQVCRLLDFDLMPDEAFGVNDFFDFERNPKEMAALFENFVRNFYRQEQKAFDVSRRRINWCAQPLNENSEGYLPAMETDIWLDSRERTESIIIDTKYYGSSLQERFGKETVHSNNLYQMFAYLTHSRLAKNFDGRSLRGILLYPQTSRPLSLHYRVQDDIISVCTVDLAQDWNSISDSLLALVA